MRLMEYITDNESIEVSTLYCDGYGFGERLLEDVMFALTIENGELKATCLNKYNPGINWDYWENECVQYALDTDVLSTTSNGDNDDGYIQK